MTRAPRVAVIGAGSWAPRSPRSPPLTHAATLWARRAEVADEITASHTNSRYLGDLALDPSLNATADLEEAVVGRRRPRHGRPVARVPRHAGGTSPIRCAHGFRS